MAAMDQTAKSPTQADRATFAEFAVLGRTFSSLTRASEIVSCTAIEVWEKQAAFLRHESLQVVRGLSSFGVHRDPRAAATAYLDVVHDGIERAIDDSRQINDLVREGAWQMVALYTDPWAFEVAGKPTER